MSMESPPRSNYTSGVKGCGKLRLLLVGFAVVSGLFAGFGSRILIRIIRAARVVRIRHIPRHSVLPEPSGTLRAFCNHVIGVSTTWTTLFLGRGGHFAGDFELPAPRAFQFVDVILPDFHVGQAKGVGFAGWVNVVVWHGLTLR